MTNLEGIQVVISKFDNSANDLFLAPLIALKAMAI